MRYIYPCKPSKLTSASKKIVMTRHKNCLPTSKKGTQVMTEICHLSYVKSCDKPGLPKASAILPAIETARVAHLNCSMVSNPPDKKRRQKRSEWSRRQLRISSMVSLTKNKRIRDTRRPRGENQNKLRRLRTVPMKSLMREYQSPVILLTNNNSLANKRTSSLWLRQARYLSSQFQGRKRQEPHFKGIFTFSWAFLFEFWYK